MCRTKQNVVENIYSKPSDKIKSYGLTFSSNFIKQIDKNSLFD
jgi:hypothetical protein